MEQNDEQAVSWFRKAAEQGYVPAQLTLGALCSEGRGVVRDVNEATRWFKRAAEQGSPLGQARYGIALARGEGVLRNIVEAWAWLKLSDEERAKEWLDAVNGKMTEKQHARAETRLVELQKQYAKKRTPDAI
jgi:TPR repeat protein